MMITRETNLNKKDSSAAVDHSSTAAAAASTWSRQKDPRIVRVSKASGCKDRHSKVYTARGLRDRRVRLSVPTAIQLYDLQDRLGFSQPSKVVEWLLTAAKHDIDELPPLAIPPGSFQATAETSSQAWSQKSGFLQEGKLSKEASDEEDDEREGTSRGRRSCSLETENAYVSDNPFTRQGSSSLSGMLNSSIPYNSFDRWDPSSLSLSHPPRSDGLTAAQPDHEWYSLGLMPIPVAASGSHHHQVLVYQQPGISTQSYNFQAPNSEMSFRCDNESTAAHQALRPVLFTATANLLDLHNDDRDNECNNGSI